MVAFHYFRLSHFQFSTIETGGQEEKPRKKKITKKDGWVFVEIESSLLELLTVASSMRNNWFSILIFCIRISELALKLGVLSHGLVWHKVRSVLQVNMKSLSKHRSKANISVVNDRNWLSMEYNHFLDMDIS